VMFVIDGPEPGPANGETEVTPCGFVAFDDERFTATLAENLRAVGIDDERVAAGHMTMLAKALEKHVNLWLAAELQMFPLVLALTALGEVKNAKVLLDGLTHSPNILMESLSLPSLRGAINNIRRNGTRAQRQTAKSQLATIVAGQAGRPRRGQPQKSSDVALATEIVTTEARLQEGWDYLRQPERPRRGQRYGDAAHLRTMGFDDIEVNRLMNSRTLRSVANGVVADRHQMRVHTLRTRASRGRRLLPAVGNR
jgi:hypothetical protein